MDELFSGPNFDANNEIWRLAKNYFRPDKKVKDPRDLLDKVLAYFKHLKEDHLEEAKLVSYEGSSNIEMIPKMRAGSIIGLCLHIGCSDSTYRLWRNGTRSDFASVIKFAEDWLFNRKFDGASAGMLNATIISRDLGLVEKRELTGANGGPVTMIQTSMSPQEAAEAYNATMLAHQATSG